MNYLKEPVGKDFRTIGDVSHTFIIRVNITSTG